MPQHHEIAPLPENMVWGYLDAAVPPVLRAASGDTVALTSWAAFNEARLRPTARWSSRTTCARCANARLARAPT